MPTAMKKSTIASLIATMTALTVPDSLVPRTSNAVIKKMMAAAGKFAMPGVASQWLCCHACGMFHPKSVCRMKVK